VCSPQLIGPAIKFQSLVPMSTEQGKERCCALDQIPWCCNDAGVVITEARWDGERHGAMNKIEDDLSSKMSFASAQDHAPEAERNTRTIKE
jgi:hypothetical protein